MDASMFDGIAKVILVYAIGVFLLGVVVGIVLWYAVGWLLAHLSWT